MALQQTAGNNYLEVGGYGMWLQSTPLAVVGPNDTYTDWAADFQYNRTIPQWHNNILSLRGTYIREDSSLNGSYAAGMANLINHRLNTLEGNAEYHFGSRYSAAIGWFNTNGTSDGMLYNQGCTPAGIACAIGGSANGSPDSEGYVANVSWWPVQNIDLAAQYTGYLKFNGRSANYDGSGRNASDNNTVYLLARFMF